MSAPAILIRLELEAPPRIYCEWLRESDEQRLKEPVGADRRREPLDFLLARRGAVGKFSRPDRRKRYPLDPCPAFVTHPSGEVYP